MASPEDSSQPPLVGMDTRLHDYISRVEVNTGIIEDIAGDYDLTPELLDVKSIQFSLYATTYDEVSSTLHLGVLTRDAPPSVLLPAHQHRSSLAHRSVPVRTRPNQYFAERSRELSRITTTLLVQNAIAARYRSGDTVDSQPPTGSGIGVGGIATMIVIAGGMYEADKAKFFDSPIGTVMALGAAASIGLVYVLAISGPNRQQSWEARNLEVDLVSRGYEIASGNLIQISPPGLPEPAHPSTRHPKPRKSRRPVALAGGSRRRP